MFFRMIFGLPGAAFVTGFLFVAMAWMIRQEAPPLPPVEAPEIKITMDSTEIKTIKEQKRRVLPPAPEPIDIDLPTRGEKPDGGVPVDRDSRKGISDDTLILDLNSTRPTIRPHPVYPENCRARGAQGVVIVEFDVTAEGEVVNPRIVSSANACLDRTVLNTIQKWKYAPKEDSSGRPVMQRGVREFFNFQLTEE